MMPEKWMPRNRYTEMMHFLRYNQFHVVLPALVPLLFLLVYPAAIHAQEKSSEAAGTTTQAKAPVSAPLSRFRKVETAKGLQGRYYFLKRPAMGVRLTYEYKDESRTSSGTTVKNSYQKFKEAVGFTTEGWVYHPALMLYTLMIEPEWSQAEEERSTGETAKSNSFSPDYSMTATFLDPKPYTFDIFASRREIPVWAAFAGNTESIVDSFGGNIRLKYKVLPTRFGYNHIETDQTGFYTSQNIRDDFHFSTRHQAGRSNTNLTSLYSDDERTSEGAARQIKTFNNTLLNNFRITEDNKIKLNSILTYRTQDTANLDTENSRIREHLNWRHLPNLQSNYTFTHNRQQSGDSESDKTSLEARLTHLLYENLTSNIGGGTHIYDYAGGRENAYDLFLDFAYTRPLSWGTLNLNSGWDYLYTDRGGFTDTTAQVTNESHTLSLGEETYLNNYNVELASIIVTNSSGTIVYFENIDYAVDVISGYARISRLPFGSITDGQPIMVSYRYLRDSEYDDTLFTENYGINFDLWHDWRFSYNYSRAKQDILSGQAPQQQIDDTIHRAQIRYDINWSDTSLTYEDNNRQSDLSYTRWKIQETLRYRPEWRLYFTLKGYFGQTDYTNRDEVKEFYGGVTTFDWLLTRWCKLRAEGYYDNTKGDVEETANTGVKAGLEFRYRIWKALLTYELTDQDNIMTDYQRTEQLVRFEIIRIMW